ncbi:MAG: thiol-disulfide isomerase, partial [Candidatus Magasanikbacteria bacterium CG10_big_fil_rev_8_21_14_0_10_43_6]
ITKLEQRLLTDPMEKNMPDTFSPNNTSQSKASQYRRYEEIVNPAGFVNSDGLALKDLVGEKIILLDFMTYSCINCQRTFPYLNEWHDKYKDAGFEIVGIHTPEFAFEKKRENVVEAAEQFGLKFPLVLDNDYATWNAYKNRYWPRKYLIDIDGYIVYDHIGEGAYEETEQKIQRLLAERRERLDDTSVAIDTSIAQPEEAETISPFEKRSPETYFGSLRNAQPGIEVTRNGDIVTYREPTIVQPDTLYLVGEWKITPEYAEAVSPDAKIVYKYRAQKVFLVMDADRPVRASIASDGDLVQDTAGRDVTNGFVTVQNEQLYRLIEGTRSETGILEIQVETPGLRAYAFTFG